jgi:small subunit ribosomal protein S17
MKKSVGYAIDSKPEQADTEDKKCPFTGKTTLRGKSFEGRVVSDVMDKTVKVEWETLVKDSKYKRYFKKRTRVAAHNPVAINAKKGDLVHIVETRPLSKTKHFAVVKVIQE